MNKEKFIPAKYGWVSPITPPTVHNNVVVLIFDKPNELYIEVLGYYADGAWQLDYDEDYEIRGWFPYPYTPHNN